MDFAYTFVHFAFEVYYFLLLANILLSWFRPVRGNVITNFIYEMTEPFLRLFRQLLPPLRIGLDLSPILAIFALYVLESLIYRLMAFVF